MQKFSLIENARDSLSHALDHIGPVQSSEAGDLKRIIVDLAHVMELLFKEKLRRIHPAFVFSNVDKYKSNTHTVGLELAFKRLQIIADIKFSKDQEKTVRTAIEKRNKITHFEFSIKKQEEKVLIGQLLSFILFFSEDHLNLEWKNQILGTRKWRILLEYKSFYDELLEASKNKICSEELSVIECTTCHNETFDTEKENCLVCGHIEQVLECRWCKTPYIYSSCEYDERAELCPSCEWKDGYAAANCEKY